MLNLINTPQIGRAQRELTLKRALFTSPFFTRLDFDLSAALARSVEQIIAAKVGVNNDFYLTEIVGNFGEVHEATGAFAEASFYTVYQSSLYRFDAGQFLPTGFLATEARFQTSIVNQVYDDRQREFFPVLIRNGDEILGKVTLANASDDATATAVLKGFNVNPNAYVSADDIALYEASLSREARYDYFNFTVEDEGLKTYTIENDSFPRLLLGFGCTNSTPDKAIVSSASVIIRDITRRLQFMETAMPLDFIAPRLTCLADAHLYYLPVEYVLPPYAKLQFIIDNQFTDDNEQGFEFNALTRTI